MRFTKFFLLALVPAALAAQTADQTSVQQRVQQIMAAQQQRIEALKFGIVRVEAQKEVGEVGSGIVVSSTPERILILTALHVVRDAKRINVVFYSNRDTEVPARKLPRHSDDLDLALLEVRPAAAAKLPADMKPYHFAAANTLTVGQHIVTANGEWVPIPNNITRLSHDGNPQKFEYTSLSVGEGFSGGPIFDDYSEIIGMHDALSPDEKFAVAIKIDSALQVLEALDYDVPKAGPAVMPFMAPAATATPATAPANHASLPPHAVPPGSAASSSSTSSPCDNGCEAKLRDFKLTQQYNYARGGGELCEEKVLQVPKDWPGAGRFLHVLQCRNTIFGQKSGVYLGTTDRKGDIDYMKGMISFTGYSGHGFITDENGDRWDVTLRSSGDLNIINLNSTTISMKPMGR
jgi:S1-C subfamily serine protease